MNDNILLKKYFINQDRFSLKIASATILSWMYLFGSKNYVNDDELKCFLNEYLNVLNNDKIEEDIINAIKEENTSSLQLACEIFRKNSTKDEKNDVIKNAINIMIFDGYIAFSEQEYLYFLCDLFDISKKELEEIYLNITYCEMPKQPLLDNKIWWESKEKEKKKSQNNDNNTLSQRLHDFGLLGLDENATESDIKKAYHRLAKIHHPDLYNNLSKEAVDQATKAFKLIKDAYERLIE